MPDPQPLPRAIVVKHPGITVQLVGEDGNAFAIIGRVQRALRQAGIAAEEVAEFRAEATAGDYDHLLATCLRWVSVE
jgi:hypothetical protein